MLTLGAVLLGVVVADDGISLFQSESESELSSSGAAHLTVVETFETQQALGDAPEWCKNESQLSWKQRKERFQQHATLEWAKTQMKKLVETNETVPSWMEQIVTADEKRGRMKWAVQEAKRMEADNMTVPAWMNDLVKE